MFDPSMTGLPLIAAVIRPLCMFLLLTGMSAHLSAAPPTAEYKLKAALIYKLTKFIEWPQLPADQARDTFGICLLGEDAFGDALDALKKRKANSLPIAVYRHTQSDAIDESCQIVFISDSKQAFLQPILQSLQNRPILTLGDMDSFAQQGGILQFTSGKKRIGFLINLESAKSSQLTIAAPLLDLATIIDSKSQTINE